MTHLKQPAPLIYPPEWFDISRAAKVAANWTCQGCSRPCGEYPGPILGVHHLDHNTFNNDPSNLLVLCRKCHLKEEGKYRHRLVADMRFNQLLAAGQLIFDEFTPLLFPQFNLDPTWSVEKT